MNSYSKANKSFSIVFRTLKNTRARNCAFVTIDKQKLNKSDKHLEEVLGNL